MEFGEQDDYLDRIRLARPIKRSDCGGGLLATKADIRNGRFCRRKNLDPEHETRAPRANGKRQGDRPDGQGARDTCHPHRQTQLQNRGGDS